MKKKVNQSPANALRIFNPGEVDEVLDEIRQIGEQAKLYSRPKEKGTAPEGEVS
jgi:hypothetical protein